MKINEQLFENVLSGKLTGKFVLRNGDTFFSAYLYRNYNRFKFTHPYIIGFGSYTPKGTFSINDTTSNFDIIDFIPDTNMKENELTIELPEGKIVDWEKSKKQNKIILKDKQLTYEDICKKLFKDSVHYTGVRGGIISNDVDSTNVVCVTDANNASSKHQLECILAKNKLANVAVYLNDGWKPDFSNKLRVFVIYNESETNILKIDNESSLFAKDMGHIMFKTEEFAQQAIEILGEKTIKLALEPLGI